MDEQDMLKALSIGSAVLAALSGVGTMVLLLEAAYNSLWSLIPALLIGLLTAGFTFGSVQFSHRINRGPVFDNEAEREVLNVRQRRELRRARGEVVMEKALIDIEHERENIVHKQIEAANDPAKPPHVTKFRNAEVASPDALPPGWSHQ